LIEIFDNRQNMGFNELSAVPETNFVTVILDRVLARRDEDTFGNLKVAHRETELEGRSVCLLMIPDVRSELGKIFGKIGDVLCACLPEWILELHFAVPEDCDHRTRDFEMVERDTADSDVFERIEGCIVTLFSFDDRLSGPATAHAIRAKFQIPDKATVEFRPIILFNKLPMATFPVPAITISLRRVAVSYFVRVNDTYIRPN
jgi:hypothetical protein